MEDLYNFIDALKNCPWYNKIFEKYPVIMLYITGSRLCGIIDECSDYDLVAICDCDNIKKTEPNIFFTWKGKKVHWSWLPLKLYTNFPQTATPLQNVGLSQFCHIQEEVIIYKNHNYIDVIKKLLENKDIIAFEGTRHLVKHFSKYIDEICISNNIDKMHYSKMLSHLCRAYFDLTKQPVDINFICSIKRIRWQPVPEEYKKKAVICIKELRNLFNKIE